MKVPLIASINKRTIDLKTKKLKVKMLTNLICYQILLKKRCSLSMEKEF